ncbi:hypothetical protein GPECTOR_1g446 [Gonium pectorale]|uniref:RAD54 protein n=1 Tax=Gonium pectorale TaxID=33097 RepID=A0A150H3U9_GONPE|nr:hypothetical protein GPECTOR_1g446 [Gonium pectorale]|eukprot:KXZ56498.1 hypothetical protein GPECTOR_1g446 [Gonium pectorale]
MAWRGPQTARPPPPSRPLVSRLAGDGAAGGAAGADEAGADEPASEEALRKRREENIKALVNNSLQTSRAPLLSKYLSVAEGELTLRKPFQSPVQGAPAMSNEVVLPEGVEPLVLWREAEAVGGVASAGTPGPAATDAAVAGSVMVDPMLVRWLRPHQREGVQFMFDCVTGQRLEGKQGCILADDMGLGKTLQGITLMWTLLTAGHPALGGCPLARRAIIVCPTSLVSNWDNECTKWLQARSGGGGEGERGRLKTLALCESSREDVVANIALFLHPSNVYKVLILSYETFRLHAERLQAPHACDLLMCDEAHRLKNDATLTNRALDTLQCKRRVLLSGTPMQNHLDEFFAMVDFCNPGVLGAPAQFRRHYEAPILAGREPDATPEQVALGAERSAQLSGLTNTFILRRTNSLLSAHLPPKAAHPPAPSTLHPDAFLCSLYTQAPVIEVVCCRLTELQVLLYEHFLASKAARRLLKSGGRGGKGGGASGVLSAITSLKKLCNHPKLIYDAVHSKAAAVAAGGGGGEDGEGRVEGFEHVGSLFPPGLFDNGRVGRGGMAAGWENLSGKMAVLARMLALLYAETNDRIVLVSNYTSSLDLFAQLCRERGYPFVRLDGTTTINKRQKLVKVFNDPAERQFAFLLSSKAGGCGLNLIGANRLVLFDPDWNPANDQQAAARVWRDGQRKRVFVYRFLCSGSIEEKVYQRQLSKEGLKQLVSKSGKAAANVMTAEDLRELFALNTNIASDTYDCMVAAPAAAASAAAVAAAAVPAHREREQGERLNDAAGAGARCVVELLSDDEDGEEDDDEEEEAAEEEDDFDSEDDRRARRRGARSSKGSSRSGKANGRAGGGVGGPAPAMAQPLPPPVHQAQQHQQAHLKPAPAAVGHPAAVLRPAQQLVQRSATAVQAGGAVAGAARVAGSGGGAGGAGAAAGKAGRSLEAEAGPHPKRQRAPGWYIDDDDDFL